MKPCIPYAIHWEFIDWLKENGFFTAPASIHHHGAYSGALFDHSLTVTQTLLSFTEKLGLSWMKERSPYIVGMFHDLCKLDNYTQTDNEAWEYNNATLLPGHGEKSVMMLQQHIQLTDEEMYCIRWHMGAFDEKRIGTVTEGLALYFRMCFIHIPLIWWQPYFRNMKGRCRR